MSKNNFLNIDNFFVGELVLETLLMELSLKKK